ncbi:MAG: DUF1836 domain-containing protein [Oscillospiraceae bacterium]|nr:DUF1836 domain-containing protein [Oscillospiraceae bacterium]MDD4413117.1 DUF1836 domain-containing protein [Oscillospiraceae bacterium]
MDDPSNKSDKWIAAGLNKWIASVDEYTPASWERLPELDLYMDQVLTFMNKHLEPFSPEGERIITPSMINNYVKDDVLPRPIRKKYSREHLGMLLMICSLKSVLSLPEISKLLHGLQEPDRINDIYADFAEAQSKAVKEATVRITDAAEQDENALCHLALQLALEANANRIAAARILSSLPEPPAADKEKEKDKDKDKK